MSLFSKNKKYVAFAFTLLLLSSSNTFAQCPVAAFCAPTNPSGTNISFGIGIRNVSLGTINYNTPANTTGGSQNGYQDYSCTVGTQLTIAVNYPISVTTNQN